MNHFHTVNRELETLEVRKQQFTYIASNITYVYMYIIMYLLAFIRIILSLICQIKDWLQK